MSDRRKASIEARLNDYTDRLLQQRQVALGNEDAKAVLDAEGLYNDSKLAQTDDAVLRKILSYAASRNPRTTTHQQLRSATEVGGDARGGSPLVDFAGSRLHSSLIDPRMKTMARGERQRPKTGGHVSPFARTPKSAGGASLDRRGSAQSALRPNERAL